MRILFLCHSFNSLSQRLFVDLSERGHVVSVEFDINEAVTNEAVDMFQPSLIIAPFLKRAIPERVWRNHICLVVHPGPVGDGGPSALDWAILNNESEWGVTVIQATGDLDAGPIWATRRFPMRAATKSSLYRNEVSEAASQAVLEAVERFEAGERQGRALDEFAGSKRIWRPGLRQADRAIDWLNDTSEQVIRKIRASDGMPGVLDTMFDEPVYLHDAHAAEGLSDKTPGAVLACRGPALARATRDGAVWIGHVRRAEPLAIKLPASMVFERQAEALPILAQQTDISYHESNGVGTLGFNFLNGAMGVSACKRLEAAVRAALARPIGVLVLAGGDDYWSNGLDLNRIEAANSAADESWANINAMDDLAEVIIRACGVHVIAAVGGNAGAGGVFLARAADEVWLRDGVILNPHYKDMGNLYGSEFWTYLLKHHAGEDNARRITQARLPMGAREAVAIGLADRVVSADRVAFNASVQRDAARIATDPGLSRRLDEKAARRRADEAEKPLAMWRAEELARMRRNFYGFDPSYHVARYNFVHKIPKSRTPLTLARHRSQPNARQNLKWSAAS